MLREAFLQSATLIIPCQSRDFEGMRNCEFRGTKRLFGFVHKVEQLQSSVHVSR